MNESNGRPEPIETLLEQFSRVALPGEVESQLRSRFDAFRVRAESSRPVATRFKGRLDWALASAAAASVLLAALFLFGSRDAWAQVVESLRSKPWVRCTLQIPEKEGLPEEYLKQPPEFSFSARHRAAAMKFAGHVQFCDFARGERFRYDPTQNVVLHESIGDRDSAEYEHLNTLLRLVADGDRDSQLPVSPIEFLDRSVRERRDGERRLTEFTFRCRDAGRSPPDYVLIVRVDPESRLPIDMTSTEKFSPDDPAVVRRYTFDYPETGPADIFALGAPRSAKIVDRRLPGGVRKVFAAHHKAARQRIEPYTALVLGSDTASASADLHFAARVRFDGQNWSIEDVDSDQFLALRERVWTKQLTPQGDDLALWWKDEIAKLTFSAAMEVAPTAGDARFPDRVLYEDNMGDPARGDAEITIDRRGTGNFSNAIQLSIRTSAGGNTRWFNPDHDYAQVRLEMDTMDHAWPYRAIIVDKLEQSPGGRWYATQVRVGDVQKSGDEPRADSGVAPVVTSLYRYFVKFDPAPAPSANSGATSDAGVRVAATRREAAEELRESKSLAALAALLRMNDDAAEGLLRIGTDMKFAIPTEGFVTDVGTVDSCGNSFLIALATAEVDMGRGRASGIPKPQPVPVAFLFDEEGRLKQRFGSRSAQSRDLSQNITVTSFGTNDSWFVWVTRFDTADPTWRLRFSDVYLVAGKTRQVLALHHQHYGVTYSNTPESAARDGAYLGFDLTRGPLGEKKKSDGVVRDGTLPRARLEWDPQKRAFRGPSRIHFNGDLVYEVDAEKSDGFKATDLPGSK